MLTKPTDLSVIVPIFNESESLITFHERLLFALNELALNRQFHIEVLYVDDGSCDDSLSIVRTLSGGASVYVSYISLSRNFGKEAALAAGIDHCAGDAALFMDSDGQHPSSLIEEFVMRWQDQGSDVIYAYQETREESKSKSLLVSLFYKLINNQSKFSIPENATDFRLLSPAALLALKQFPERARFFKGLSSWIGFKQSAIPYQPEQRIAGKTKWSFLGLVLLSFESIISFSVIPLRIITLLGVLVAMPALLYGLWIVFEKVILGVDLPGYPSIMTAVVFLGGSQLVILGLLGEYIGHILQEVKARPVYLIKEQYHTH